MVKTTMTAPTVTSCRPSTSSRSEKDQMTKTPPAPTTPEERAAGAHHWSARSRSRLHIQRKKKEADDWCPHLRCSHSVASPHWIPPSHRGVAGKTGRDATQTSVALSLQALTGSMKRPMATWQVAQAPPPPRPPSSGVFFIAIRPSFVEVHIYFLLYSNKTGYYSVFVAMVRSLTREAGSSSRRGVADGGRSSRAGT